MPDLLKRTGVRQLDGSGPALNAVFAGAIRQFANGAQTIEFYRRAKELGCLHDQVFDVFQCDILGQIPDPDLFGH
ncbi:MAG: hypothetical protein ABIQ51_00295, partial [Mesorhizobium sp.]